MMDSPETTTPAVEDHRGTPSPSWTVSTNWTIAGGSFSSSVAVESSFSPLDDDCAGAEKSPLILYPSSPDSSPCEITILFPHKHEVRQVYLRSTARIYEMYYATKHGSGNEYLLTVRCGIAEREGQVLRADGVEEAILAHQRSRIRDPDSGGVRTGNNLMPSEDDWVEVKAAVSSQPLGRNLLHSVNRDAVSASFSQDLYEATAEIADANPCMSFTLRLLSLMNKGCVCVEEVYVFADPVHEDNLDNQAGPLENTSGNSIMAMLVPTILQLSRSKALDRDSSNVLLAKEKHKLVDIGFKETEPNNSVEESQLEDVSSSSVKQETKLPDTVVSSVVPVQLGTSQHVADVDDKHGKPTSQAEGILDHLVSRINRMEDHLLRFEDRILKPLNNIDERLQRVEHLLEVITKKTGNSGLVSCMRISAPEFSCCESESNSLYNSVCMDSGNVANEDKMDLPASSNFSEMPISDNASKNYPSLQVSAPEFSNYDAEDEDLTPETVEEASDDQDPGPETVNEAHDNHPVRALSINNALAAALAGFLTSAAVPSQTDIFSVKAPEFSTEDEGINLASASPEVDSCKHAKFSCFREPDTNQEYLLTTAFNESSVCSDDSVVESLYNHNKQKTIEEGDESWFCNMLNIVSPEDVGADHIGDDMNNGKAGTSTGNFLDPDNTAGLEEISKNQMIDGTDVTQEIVTSIEPAASADIPESGSKRDCIDNIIGFVHFASVPNYFDPQILDVKFASHETFNENPSLEALLSETSDLNVETPAVDEGGKDDLGLVQQSSLIPVEDWGTANGLISVDMDYYSVREALRDAEAGILEDSGICSSRQEISTESLI